MSEILQYNPERSQVERAIATLLGPQEWSVRYPVSILGKASQIEHRTLTLQDGMRLRERVDREYLLFRLWRERRHFIVDHGDLYDETGFARMHTSFAWDAGQDNLVVEQKYGRGNTTQTQAAADLEAFEVARGLKLFGIDVRPREAQWRALSGLLIGAQAA